MRSVLLLVIGAVCSAFLLGLPASSAAWGSCMPAVAGPGLLLVRPTMPSADAGYRWQQLDAEEYVLYRGVVQVGNLRLADGLYFARKPSGGFESEASTPPIDPPEGVAALAAGKRKCGCTTGCTCGKKKCGCTSAKRCNPECKCARVIGEPDGGCPCTGEPECRCPLDCDCGKACIKNFGVYTPGISTTERYTINGRTVTREQMEAEIGRPDVAIPDDSAKLSLTVIGSEEERARALADLQAPALAAFRERVLVQDYAPDSPLLKAGFVTTGKPTIYLQKPDGAVLARVDHYDGPQTWEAVRKADPNYAPSKDPDPTRPKPAPVPDAPDEGGVQPGVIVAAVLGLACFAALGLLCIAGFVLLLRAMARRPV